MKEAALWNSANQGDKRIISSIQGDLIEYFPHLHLHGGKPNITAHTRFLPQKIKRIRDKFGKESAYRHPRKLLSSRKKDVPGVLFTSETYHITFQRRQSFSPTNLTANNYRFFPHNSKHCQRHNGPEG